MLTALAVAACHFTARPGHAASASGTPGGGLNRSAFPVVERKLDNGLRVLLLRDASVPTISYYTFFDVGSRNEQPGITGISHLFEHMMFNGSEKFGPKEFDRQLESRGGYSNAYTSSDVTAYHDDFDRSALELVIDLESDRMRALRITDEMLASEREVVKEERRFRVDNDIGGMLDEQLDALAYLAHPYRWPVIGWMGDIERISREDCEAYFRTYYAPNNAIVVAVGDLDVEQTFALIEKYYRDIPSGPPAPEVPAYEPEQKGERRGVVHFPAQSPAVALGYRTVEATHADAAALDVIQAVLSIGEGSRLRRELVRRKEVVTSVVAWFEWRRDPGLFKVSMSLPPEGDVPAAVAALDEEIARLRDEPLGEAELDRAKNILRGQFLRAFGTNNGRAHTIGEHELLFGKWTAFFDTLDNYGKVTAQDVQRVARTYLVPQQRTLIELVPTGGEGEGAEPSAEE